MPSVLTSLDETRLSILNSAVYKIILDVVKQLGIPNESIVAMRNGVELNKTDNATNMTVNSQPNLPSTVSKRKVFANVTEDFDDNYLTASPVSQPDAVPIFRDPAIDASVFPVYVMSKITINFVFTTPSKSEANRIRDDIRVRLSQGRNILHHETEFNIIVPKVVEEFISDLHELKSRLFPQSLDDYFLSNSTKRVHMVTDLTGKENARIAVRENIGHVVGTLLFSPMPEAVEEDNDTNTYKLTIPYELKL
ncbi:hypothetical protein, partial [Flavobacterium sp.]|uniref:hypothetical protein n=1 Tax=Flavobacterium sp. TaxID=239 RepID=UPI0037BEE8A4